MLNLFRLIAVVLTGLVVFGWARVEGQTGGARQRGQGDLSQLRSAVGTLQQRQTLRAKRFAVDSPPSDPVWTEVSLERPPGDTLPVPRPFPRQRELHGTLPLSSPSLASQPPRPAWSSAPLPPRAIKALDSTASHHVTLRPSVAVDLQLLSQRMTSYELSVLAIRDRLRGTPHWDLASLESVVGQVEELVQARQLWQLYYGVLNDREQGSLGSIESLRPIAELLEQRLFEVEVAVDLDPLTVSRFSKQETKQRLALLSQRVNKLARLHDEPASFPGRRR